MTDVAQGSYGMPYSDPAAVMPSGNDPNPVHVGFAHPVRQKRLTVLFRAILVIPHLIVLAALGIAAEVVVLIGWFGALFTGRLPDFAAQFLVGYLRWDARVLAYHLLLTDAYPPFSLDDADYPLRLAVEPRRLNRLAVFFRIILAIPAALLNAILSFGASTIVAFVTWLIVLISGTMPVALHQALSAVLRYSLRYSGYTLLVTGQYPAGVFGDQQGPAAAGPPGAPDGTAVATAPPEPGTPSAPASGPAVPSSADLAATTEGTQPAPSAPPVPATPAEPVPPLTADPPPGTYPQGSLAAPGAMAGYPAPDAWAVPGGPPWPLALSGAARKLVSLFMALGVLALAAYITFIALVISNSPGTLTRQQAISQVQAAQAQANLTLTKYSTQISACNSASDVLHCATGLDKQAAQALGTFAVTIRSLRLRSPSATAAAGRLADAATSAEQAFARLGAATSISQYEGIETSVNFQQLTSQIGLQFQALDAALSASP